MKAVHYLPFFASLTSAIWPLPTSYDHGDTVLWMSDDVAFNWAGTAASASNVGSRFLVLQEYLFSSFDESSNRKPKREGTEWQGVSGDDIIRFAIEQTKSTILKRNFVPWKFHPRGWSEPIAEGATYVSSITLELLGEDPPSIAKPLAGSVDESYSLTLTTTGEATILANTSLGLRHGLNTFTQLFYKHSSDGAYTALAPVQIFDAPKFEHRGINMDVARQWYPAKDIARMIDTAAYNKMNRFHLHVTDSQSWPLEIPSLPELAAKGAYRPELYYSTKEFEYLQKRAALQGVELITEIDMPGHTSIIHEAYPDLIAAYNIQPNWDTYSAEPPSGTLKLNSSDVDTFLSKLFDDLLPRIFPFSTYFHTGGDEVNKNAYELDDTVKSKDPEVLQPLMQAFIDRNHDQVRSQGLTPIVWEEMLLDWNLTLGKDTVVQSWRSDEAVASIVSKGYKALVGNYKYWYLDCGKGQWLDFSPERAAAAWPFQDYCAPFHNWRLVYSYDPLAGVPSEYHHLVIGGEAHLWSEQTDPINLDRMIWPRASAAAEVLWSGVKDAQGQNRSQFDASPRLSEMRERMVARGVGAEPVQMPYCTMDGEQCQLGLLA
ncbi:glycoside hydrolase family 20 protein [Aaosphaeria arxii CBS 175.79]|uniref:Beta-hexosaminidase n=1 Tax=Aaosphaeria arxii CBS 175.79 TaxID=1450172 RepID=A0A6A5XIX0_9PLEO|nr:glycoside hydrolase family 20 protein [Aaosphaeria arxii CBS 175.79]KAF2012254.1 glycoside hydrolase family 20 protein [Aaosphaeria arxii CBS 175.79]